MEFLKFKKLFQLFFGVFLMIAGAALLIGTPWLQKLIIQTAKVLKPDGFLYKMWQKYPPLIHRFYIFDWKNPEDLYNPKIKPRFEEVGPFVFEFRSEKANITWNDNNTITYRNLRYWYFDEAKSVANLSHKIVTVNAISYAAAYRMRWLNPAVQRLANFFIRSLSPKMYIEKTVGEILFDGYTEPLLKLANIALIPKIFDFPEVDKVGWLRLKNGSQLIEEYLNIGTHGEDTGQIHQWNFLNELPFYSNSCNAVTGSASEFFSSYLEKGPVYVFWPEACRTFLIDFEKETSYKGIKTYKYTSKNAFDNGTVYPENKCFQLGEDVPSGLLNMSTCRYGLPLFSSAPHFYGADPIYLNSVEGLSPNEDKHLSFALIEPTAGVPIYGKGRLQGNILLYPNKYLSMFADAPRIYMPVFWLEQDGDLPARYILYLKLFLNSNIIIQLVAGIIACLGVFVFILGIRRKEATIICSNRNERPSCKTVMRFVEIIPPEIDEIKQLLNSVTENKQ